MQLVIQFITDHRRYQLCNNIRSIYKRCFFILIIIYTRKTNKKSIQGYISNIIKFIYLKDLSKLSMFYKTQKRPDHNGNDEDGLLVIGVGLPRTGTTSLSHALSFLLRGSCFHGSRLPNLTNEEYDFWLRALGNNTSQEQFPSINEWRNVFRNEKACLDLPSILFYKELMLAFPKVAK